MLLLLLACAPDSPALDGAPTALLVAHLDGGEVLRFRADGTPQAPVVSLEAVAAIEAHTDRTFAPSAVVRTEDGGAWVSDFVTGAVVAVDADGAFAGVVREAGSGAGRLEEPCAMVLHDGRVAVLGNDSGNVVFVDDPSDAAVLGVPDPLRRPHGLELWAGEAWVGRSATEPDAGQVQRFDLATGQVLGAFAPWPQVEEATAVRLHDDELLVADFFQDRVTAWDPWSGAFLGEVVAGLEGPIDVEVDGEGALWVLDREGVVRVDPLGGEAERVLTADELGPGWTRDLVLVP
jgi:streptogramin lyase